MNELIEKLKADTIMAASHTNSCADDKDVKRNHVNYGFATAYANVLRDLGHAIDIPCWADENGCLRVSNLKINGRIFKV